MSHQTIMNDKFIQGYKISKQIGQGKFSTVYCAHNEKNEVVALKKIQIFDMENQNQRQKCLKEVDLMKNLNHPNIIRYIDSFIANNELIIVTQWAEKGDLKKLIKQHEGNELPFDEQKIWQYMKQISSALQHMHEKRIMHRDLKPANIFISHENVLKIGDLGLGRIISQKTLELYSKVGTPLYMSPQLINNSGYSQNADVWSLGCICYELCQLKSPFRNKQQKINLRGLFDNITQYNYKPISAVYSSTLSNAIKNMIVVDPSLRWSSQQVYENAVRNLQNFKKSKLDPIICMSQILIKLNLLQYQKYFCQVMNKKTIHKYYFALPFENKIENQQLYYFIQLCYWVMAMFKPDKKKQKLALYSKTLIDLSRAQSACQKLLKDISTAGIKIQDIRVMDIRDGYGQDVCYLLNQILNRELIRTNFQFKKPIMDIPKNNHIDRNNQLYNEQEEGQEQDQEIQKDLQQQSIEQQPFEQSIFIDKKNRIKNINEKLLMQIEQLQKDDQDRMIIYSKINQKQWKQQCLRLDKKFNQITQNAKQLRRKHGYQHFQIIKTCTSKLKDLIAYVKPAATSVYQNIDKDLQAIQKGEKHISSQYKDMGLKYKQINKQYKQLSSRSVQLQTMLNEQHEAIEIIDKNITKYQDKITSNLNNHNANNTDIKKHIIELQRQITLFDTYIGIKKWQLLNNKKQHGKEVKDLSSSYTFAENI